MPHHSISSNLLIVSVLVLLLDCTTASRRLLQVGQCGSFLKNTDVPGADLPGSGQSTASNQACLTLCQNTATCNAMTRSDGSQGFCYLKSVNVTTVTPVASPGYTSYLVCNGTTSPPPPPPPSSSPLCDEFLLDTDLSGPEPNLPGSGFKTKSYQECLNACSTTPTCNVMVRVPSGECFLKNLNPNTLQPQPRPTVVSYLICTPLPPTPPPPPPNPAIASKGKFGPVINFPLIPVSAAALTDGKVLVWSGASTNDFAGGPSGATVYAIFDSNGDTIGPAQTVNLGHDMFCPGISILPNGNIFVVAGSAGGDGAGSSSLWTGSSWSQGPQLKIPRGYNAAVMMTNGNVLTLGGSFSGVTVQDKGAEVYDGNSWVEKTGIAGQAIKTDDPQGVFRQDNYPFLFAWANNSVFHAGPSKGMNWLTNLEGTGTITGAGTRGGTAMNGNFVMYQAGKILTVGGSSSYSLGTGARTGAEVITLGAVGTNPTVKAVPAPKVPRTYATAVVLPTGEVVHFGGSFRAVEFSDETAVLTTEIWDPISETWSDDADLAVPRTYHSVAVLMPDGRVLTGGGGYCGNLNFCVTGMVNHPDAQIYSPRYLFKPDNTPATRPTCSVSAGSVAPGGSLTVSSSQTLSMVSMVRFGSTTHSTNYDQRRLELCGPSTLTCGANSVTVPIPHEGVATKGPWMVFCVNSEGVVSEATILNVM